MILDANTLVVLSAAAFSGAFVTSFAGFAFSPVAGVILMLVLPAKTIIPVLMICSVIVQAGTLVCARKSLALGSVGPMLIGGALGVPIAVQIYHRTDLSLFQVSFGLFLVAYAAIMLVRPSRQFRVQTRPATEVAVGFLGGLVGGLTAMPGAVPVLYCDCTGAGKEVQRAKVQPFILVMQVLALALIAVHGDLDARTAELVGASLPALALGVVAGLKLFGSVSEASFRRLVLLLLLATGLALAALPPRGAAASTASHSPVIPSTQSCPPQTAGGEVHPATPAGPDFH
ncbi:sulfite exporter TauE/SafE family protein [Enterovirga sp.]|uniref:sulfite exporter TauE/SafE family protein n=1 Tax=Enterovirga sp. TaxID=2026350 RepID=UPI002613CA44|nr:sulfite exporter TauE/SafE family protein [Enterovirga sp.]MDB5592661.1 sulfite exporter TauE/SafE family protein [Enterovirga sp.]